MAASSALLMVSSGVGGMRMPYMTLIPVLIGMGERFGGLVQVVLFPGITMPAPTPCVPSSRSRTKPNRIE